MEKETLKDVKGDVGDAESIQHYLDTFNSKKNVLQQSNSKPSLHPISNVLHSTLFPKSSHHSRKGEDREKKKILKMPMKGDTFNLPSSFLYQ